MSKPLFEDIQDIGIRIASASHIFLAVDFDGILASRNGDGKPAKGRLPPEIDRALRVLADDPDISVAIVSAQERTALQARVNIPGLIYAGNHGLEISGPGRLYIEPAAVEHAAMLNSLAATLERKLEGFAGTEVENKGLMLGVHCHMDDPAGAGVGRIVHSVLAGADHPFQLSHTSSAYEIRPRSHWNKGVAVQWIMQQLEKPGTLPIYMGDDASDEEAFAALAEGITIRVGDVGSTRAKYRLIGTFEAWDFLAWLIKRPKK